MFNVGPLCLMLDLYGLKTLTMLDQTPCYQTSKLHHNDFYCIYSFKINLMFSSFYSCLWPHCCHRGSNCGVEWWNIYSISSNDHIHKFVTEINYKWKLVRRCTYFWRQKTNLPWKKDKWPVRNFKLSQRTPGAVLPKY
jgi:hypothetical protein